MRGASAPFAPLAIGTALLAAVATRGVLAATGGQAAVPLDDSYIHFQYARSFAELHPLAYTPGSAPAPGATSLLWPALLAPFWLLGARGAGLVWVAWAFGWVALGALAHETHRLAQGLVRRELALGAGAMVLAFGGLVWCAGSGMEVVPFSWLLVRAARRAADWGEADGPASRRARLELVVLAVATPLMRPEGLIASLGIAAVLALCPRGGPRTWALLALVGPALPPLIQRALTGQVASTTALVKWLPSSPYHGGGRLLAAIASNLELLFGTLLDGRIWSALFVPSGARFIAWAALPALLVVTFRSGRRLRGALALAVALGMLLPTSYDSFLWNRLRYLWPFAPGWFVALAALAEGMGALAERLRRELGWLRVLVVGVFVGGLASQLSRTLEDLAESADAIRRQQADLGRWAKDALPKDAVIGVNDTGAIAYFSERRVFDVVGLTTRGEAKYWVAGPGSRFEHYERMPKSELPTHFIVYPEWMAIPPLLGTTLTDRVVSATILGGQRMVACEADYSALGSAEAPLAWRDGKPLDRLDVADLESERAHGYELFWATQAENHVVESASATGPLADGARDGRSLDRFEIELTAGGTLVARLAAQTPVRLDVFADDRKLGELSLGAVGAWEEPSLAVPSDLASGRRRLSIRAPDGVWFTALHYWSFAAGGGKGAR